LTQALSSVGNKGKVNVFMESQIANSILSKILTFDLSDVVFDFPDIMIQVHDKIVDEAQAAGQSSKTIRNHRRSYNFLMRYSEIRLLVPSSLYDDLAKEKEFHLK
jgi:hypothetical protein